MLPLLGALILIIAVASWLRRARRGVASEPWEPEDEVEPIDREALEAAEREARDRRSDPEEEAPGDDWGPGTGQ